MHTTNISYVKGGIPPLASIIFIGSHKVCDTCSMYSIFEALNRPCCCGKMVMIWFTIENSRRIKVKII